MQATSLVLLSDQMALQRSVDIIANNVANSSTSGFKRENLSFSTILSAKNTQAPIDFVMDRATYRDNSSGAISSTGNPLDLAIQGNGYFQVQTAKGTAYTRAGAFRLDNQGQIVTSGGQPVLSDGGQALTLPDEATDISISGDGFITAQVGTGSTRAQLGKIGVVSFANEQQMNPVGQNMFKTGQTATPVIGNVIVQGAIEQSNVKPISEMTALIQIQRAYEQATNMISNENTRLSTALDKLSQVTA